MRCMFCGIHRDYYTTEENANRQNCRDSDSGYHYFVHFPCLMRLFTRRPQPERLLAHRRIKRPHTI